MIIALLGASSSGKSIIEHEIAEKCGYEKIISYTTRLPRVNETNGKDYYFINNDTFNDMRQNNLFAEYDEYSQNRFYGTLISDYFDGDRVAVLTPNGLRQLKKNCKSDNIFTVLVKANLGTRIKRYIDRCGVDNFNFDDKNEIASRVDRDFGMFLGLENEVDLVIENNEGTDINDLITEIIKNVKKKEN